MQDSLVLETRSTQLWFLRLHLQSGCFPCLKIYCQYIKKRNTASKLASLVPIQLQLFKGDPNNENQHLPPNLTSDDP